MEKPTGDAECPPHIDRAHAIEEAMGTKAGLVELDDEDIDKNSNDTVLVITSSDEGPPTAKRIKKEALSPLMKSALMPKHRRKNTSHDLLQTILTALDPMAQRSHANDRLERSFANNQMISLSNQLRVAQSTIDNLRDRIHRAERRADRAELLAIVKAKSTPTALSKHKHRRHRRREIEYPDGGHATIWPHSSDESDHFNVTPKVKMQDTSDWSPPSPAKAFTRKGATGKGAARLSPPSTPCKGATGASPPSTPMAVDVAEN
jgi:hypothetical protein